MRKTKLIEVPKKIIKDDPKETQEQLETELFELVKLNKAKEVDKFIKVNSINLSASKIPFLGFCLENGFILIAMVLIFNGASPNICTAEGLSPLELAIIKGQQDFLELILVHPNLNINIGKRPPLILAAFKKDSVLVKKLLDLGADTIALDPETKKHASAIAIENGDGVMMNMIYDAQEEKEIETPKKKASPLQSLKDPKASDMEAPKHLKQ